MAKFCTDCGGELTEGNKCTKCGVIVKKVVTELIPEKEEEPTPVYAEVEVEEETPEVRKWDICSIIGFSLSIANLFTCGILGLPALVVSIVGYIFVIVNDYKGKLLAELGIVISLIFTTLVIVFLLLMSGT